MPRKKVEVKGKLKPKSPKNSKKVIKKPTATKKQVIKKQTGKPKTTAAKKPATPARKPATRKKPVGFEMMKSYQNAIEKSFELLQKHFDAVGVTLNEYAYEGKKKNAPIARQQLMDITKEAKKLRDIIQEAKVKLKPVYKEN